MQIGTLRMYVCTKVTNYEGPTDAAKRAAQIDQIQLAAFWWYLVDLLVSIGMPFLRQRNVGVPKVFSSHW